MKFEVIREDKFIKEYKVSVDAKLIKEKLDDLIANNAKTFKMHGFRAGKAPLDIVKKYTEHSALEKVLERLIEDACNDLISENNNAKLAQHPQYEIITQYSDGNDFEFTCKLFFAPDFNVQDQNFKLEYIDPVISDHDIDKWISELKQIDPIWKISDDGAKSGDLVVYKAPCFVDGKKDDARSIRENRIIIPENIQDDAELINGFLGKKIKDSFDFTPATDTNCNYKVIIKHVYTRDDISDDEYASKLGFENLGKLREFARVSILNKMKKDAFLYYKNQILDMLDDQYSFDIPENVVEIELNNMIKNIRSDNKTYGEDSTKSEEDLKTEYRDVARQRVKLGYILNNIASTYKITVTSDEIYNDILSEALNYPDNMRKDVIKHYANNRSAYMYKQASLVEEKVIRFIIDKAEKVTKQMGVDELKELVSKIMDS